MPVVLSLPVTPHTVTNVTREGHGIFLATLATGVQWRVSREELLSMDQGPAKLITLELQELRANMFSAPAVPAVVNLAEPCCIDNVLPRDVVSTGSDEFIDEFIYHPPGECPPTPDLSLIHI